MHSNRRFMYHRWPKAATTGLSLSVFFFFFFLMLLLICSFQHLTLLARGTIPQDFARNTSLTRYRLSKKRNK